MKWLRLRVYLLLFFYSLVSLYASPKCSCTCGDKRMNLVGRSGWHFMHTLAANYPDNPSFYQKYSWYGFFETIIYFYPCEKCRNHLWYNVDRFGLHTSNKTDFNMFLCYLHNDINKEQGKEMFPCDMKLLLDKYGFKNSTVGERKYI